MPRLAQLALKQAATLPRTALKTTAILRPEGKLRQGRLRLVDGSPSPSNAPSATSSPSTSISPATPPAMSENERVHAPQSAPPALHPAALAAALTQGLSQGPAAVSPVILDAPLGDAIVGAGDTLIIAERPPTDGDLALIEGADGTRRLRRLYRDGDFLLLQPEDHSIAAERSPACDVSVVGTVITIVRRLAQAEPLPI